MKHNITGALTYLHLLDAVNIVNGHRHAQDESPITKQLAQSLQVYKDRGEFDGTMASAKECLEQACYEFDFQLKRKD